MDLWRPGEGWDEGTVRELGMDMCAWLFLKCITNKDLLPSTGNSAQCYVPAWMGGEFWGRMDTGMCVAESLHCSPETVTTLLTGCAPTQNNTKERVGGSLSWDGCLSGGRAVLAW